MKPAWRSYPLILFRFFRYLAIFSFDSKTAIALTAFISTFIWIVTQKIIAMMYYSSNNAMDLYKKRQVGYFLQCLNSLKRKYRNLSVCLKVIERFLMKNCIVNLNCDLLLKHTEKRNYATTDLQFCEVL